MKRLLCCIMALTMIGSATAFAAEPVDNSAIAEKALSEVTALYEDLYTITNAEAEVQNSTYDDMGNIIVDVVVSFDRTLKATCAEDSGVSDDNAGGVIHHALRHIKDPHHNIPGIGDNEDGAGGFENPLEEHRAFNVVEVVLVHNELDQLQGHHKGQNDPGYGHHDRLRKVLDHAENIAVPCLGGKPDLRRDLADLLIDLIKHAGQVAHDAADQDFLQPVSEDLYNKIQG